MNPASNSIKSQTSTNISDNTRASGLDIPKHNLLKSRKENSEPRRQETTSVIPASSATDQRTKGLATESDWNEDESYIKHRRSRPVPAESLVKDRADSKTKVSGHPNSLEKAAGFVKASTLDPRPAPSAFPGHRRQGTGHNKAPLVLPPAPPAATPARRRNPNAQRPPAAPVHETPPPAAIDFADLIPSSISSYHPTPPARTPAPRTPAAYYESLAMSPYQPSPTPAPSRAAPTPAPGRAAPVTARRLKAALLAVLRASPAPTTTVHALRTTPAIAALGADHKIGRAHV